MKKYAATNSDKQKVMYSKYLLLLYQISVERFEKCGGLACTCSDADFRLNVPGICLV